VRIEHLAYDVDAFRERIEIPEAEILEHYESFRDERYTLPEQVRTRHILFRLPPGPTDEERAQVRERAEGALQRLRDGEDFAAVAVEVSEDPATRDEGGDLGFVARGRLEETFEEAAFSLEPGTISDLVETRFGLHIVKVEERQAERVQTLEEVRDVIVERLKTLQARDFARDAAFDDSQLAMAGKPLEEIAGIRGIELRTPPPFSQHESVVGLPPMPDLVREASTLPAGEVGPVATGDRVFVLYRVKEIIPSHIPDLAEVRSRAERQLREELATARAREIAEEARQALLEGASLEEVGRERGAEVEETGGIRRTGAYIPKIGNAPGLKEKAFSLPQDSPVLPEVVVAGGDAFLVVVKERLPADPDEFVKKRDEIVERHRADQQEAAIVALLNDLKRRGKVDVNPGVLAGV
jgi:peptidyl-prolyl cis-trans isomerase D